MSLLNYPCDPKLAIKLICQIIVNVLSMADIEPTSFIEDLSNALSETIQNFKRTPTREPPRPRNPWDTDNIWSTATGQNSGWSSSGSSNGTSSPPPLPMNHSSPPGDKRTWVSSKVALRPRSVTHCIFCAKNGEHEQFFKSHILKDPFGKVLCPILRKYKCPLCKQQGGDNAHTVTHCPLYNGRGCFSYV